MQVTRSKTSLCSPSEHKITKNVNVTPFHFLSIISETQVCDAKQAKSIELKLK